MNLCSWPMGLHQDLPVHQHTFRRRLLFVTRSVTGAPRHNAELSRVRCLAQKQHVADPVVTDPAPAPSAEHPGSNGVAKAAGSPSTAYPFTEIEAKWRHHWLQNKTFATPDIASLDTSKPKFYALDMWVRPDPSDCLCYFALLFAR